MGTAAAIRVPIGQRPVIGNNTPRLISLLSTKGAETATTAISMKSANITSPDRIDCIFLKRVPKVRFFQLSFLDIILPVGFLLFSDVAWFSSYVWLKNCFTLQTTVQQNPEL